MRLIEDRRLGGGLRYYLLREDERLPQIPPEVLNCVGFLSPRETGTPDGTVFFVRIHEDDPGCRGPISAIYAVTAKHLLEQYLAEEGSEQAWLRLNKRTGGVVPIRTKIEDWRPHATADVAIHWWPLDHDFDIMPFPVRQHLIDDIIHEWNVTAGDDVFLSGLFWQHTGQTRNAPIVRLGSIAAMRGEKVYTTTYGEMDAYLIEVRSVGGLSGSPIFFNGEGQRRVKVQAASTSGRPLRGHVEKKAEMTGFFLLGLAHGHYNVNAQRIDGVEDVINSGIAIAVPADKILELILDPEEKAMAKEKREKAKQKRASSVADRATMPLTDEEFQKMLEKVSRRIAPAPPDRGKKGT